MAYPVSQVTVVAVPNGNLTAANYNAEFQNVYNNVGRPENIDDFSENVAEMQLQTDPGEVGSENQAISMSGEIERLRFAIRDVKNFIDPAVTHWYETPQAFSPSLLTSLAVTSTTDANVAVIQANVSPFTSDILQLRTFEEDTGSFMFLRCTSDTDGVATDQFTVNQAGDVDCRDVSCQALTVSSTLTVGTDNLFDQIAPIGTIIPHYDFAGALTVNSTYWALCNNQVVTVEGIGSQSLPELSNRYLVGFGTENGGDIGSATFETAPVGNANHVNNFSHTHTVNSHSHTVNSHNHSIGSHSHTLTSRTGWASNDGVTPPNTGGFDVRNEDGSRVEHIRADAGVLSSEGQHRHDLGGSTDSTNLGSTGNASPSTSSSSPGTSTGLSASEDIQPRSIRVRYYMRIK
jgi:hypothetical protein